VLHGDVVIPPQSQVNARSQAVTNGDGPNGAKHKRQEMACRKKRLTRVEVEKCEFNGQQLRFVTGRTRDQAGSRKLVRLTFLPLPAGTYEKRIPREITRLLIP